MKFHLPQVILQHLPLWLALLAAALVLLISAIDSGGYVLLAWLGWQLQTTMCLMLMTLLLAAAGWFYLVKWIQRTCQRQSSLQTGHISHVQQLTVIEQLGCWWLLDANTSLQPEVEAILAQSPHLAGLMAARKLREQGQYGLAWQQLQQRHLLHDLVLLEKIGLLLAEKNYPHALDCLSAQSQRLPSAFAHSIFSAWQAALQRLWAKLAQDAPWRLLAAADLKHIYQLFTPEQRLHWLTALSGQMAPSSPAQQHQLLGFFDYLQAQPEFLQDWASARQWLFLLALWPVAQPSESAHLTQQPADPGSSPDPLNAACPASLAMRRVQLAERLLQLQFEPGVLGIWMQGQLMCQTLHLAPVIQRLDDLAQRYPGQPSIALAQYHQWLALGQTDRAQALLQQWPQHRDFCYLRLQLALADQPALMADIKRLYEQSSAQCVGLCHNPYI